MAPVRILALLLTIRTLVTAYRRRRARLIRTDPYTPYIEAVGTTSAQYHAEQQEILTLAQASRVRPESQQRVRGYLQSVLGIAYFSHHRYLYAKQT